MTVQGVRRILCVAAIIVTPSLAPAAPQAEPEVPVFEATTELVYVRFHVLAKGKGADAYVGTVRADQIQVLEDGRPQKVVLLETPETRVRTIPPQITLLLDMSGSVRDANLLTDGLFRTVLAGLREEAMLSLCAFGNALECPVPSTRDPAFLLSGFQEIVGRPRKSEGTRLYASIVDLARSVEGREKAQRSLIVFSDGVDMLGGSMSDARQAVLDNEIHVYAILLGQGLRKNDPTSSTPGQTGQTFGAGGAGSMPGGGFGASTGRLQYDYKKFELDALAQESGGKSYEPAQIDDKTMGELLRDIVADITMECVVGYQPEGPATGKKRKIKVELVDKSLGKIDGGERRIVR